MKRPALFTALTTTLLLAAAPMTGNVEASTLVQRCQMGDGTVLYTDKPCAAEGAQSLSVSAELRNRIASAEATERRLRAEALRAQGLSETEADFAAEFADASMALATPAPARRPANAGCAANPQQLATDLRASMALGDVNRVAESYAWMGMSHADAQRTLDRLQGMMERPLLDVQYYGAAVASLPSAAMAWDDASSSWVETSAPAPRIASSGGIMQLTLAQPNGGRHSIDFNVREYADCWFVQY